MKTSHITAVYCNNPFTFLASNKSFFNWHERDCSMRFLKLVFFIKQPLLVPLEVIQSHFLILATFHGVVKVLKPLPSVQDQDTKELKIPGGVENLRCPRHWGFFLYYFFQLQANLSPSGTSGISEFPVPILDTGD